MYVVSHMFRKPLEEELFNLHKYLLILDSNMEQAVQGLAVLGLSPDK